jgi:hypothetical protein
MVKNMAAIWLRVTVEASSPMPVEHRLNSTPPGQRGKAAGDGHVPNTVTAASAISPKLSSASST